jgi:NADH-quinone oxidoreductase subunit E
MKASGNLAALEVNPADVLSADSRAKIDGWLSKFPADKKRSAVIRALFIAQEQNQGFLTEELIVGVTKYLDIPATWGFEVASFYSMLHVGKCGRNKVSICTNISCWLNGAQKLVDRAEKKLGIALGESTADGRIHLVAEEECLAACVRAPMMMVNGHYHENLQPEDVDRILDGLQ